MPSSHCFRSLSVRRQLCLVATCFVVCLPRLAEAGFEGPPGDVEIEFAPMDMSPGGGGGDPLMEMLAAAGGGPRRPPAHSMRGPAQGGREADLDNMLAGVINGMLGPGGPPGRMGPGGFGGRHRGGMPPEVTEEIVLDGPGGGTVVEMDGPGPFGGPIRGGPGGGTVVEMDGPGPFGGPIRGKQGGRSSLPAGLLRDMFPGSMMGAGAPVVIEGPSGDMFGGPDPIMMDIMQDMDRTFASEMMPAIHKATPAERDPKACKEDVKKKCVGAKSHLHCLGINHDSISEDCRKAVGQSVPFRCSKSIDRFCDVLQTGILSCLYDHMPDLEPSCRDAVLTTKHVINKVNNQKATLVDPSSGAKKVSTPASSTGSTQSQKEATLDVRLGLAQTAVAPKKDNALLAKTSMPQAKAFFGAPPAQGWLPQSHGFIFLIVALVAFGAYLVTFTDYTQKVRAHLTCKEGVEGAKLLGGVELPKPDTM